MSKSRWFASLAVVLLALSVGFAGAAAQACIATPTFDRQMSLAGTFSFTDGMKGYGAGLNANLAGPLSVGASYTLLKPDNIDTNGNGFGAGMAYEIPGPSVSLCPVVNAGYTRFHEEEQGAEATVSNFSVPVGFAIGKQFAAGQNFSIIVAGTPYFLHTRMKMSADGPLGETEFSDSSNEFGTDFAVRFVAGAFHFGGSAGFTTIDGSDPTFSLGLGYVFGATSAARSR